MLRYKLEIVSLPLKVVSFALSAWSLEENSVITIWKETLVCNAEPPLYIMFQSSLRFALSTVKKPTC